MQHKPNTKPKRNIKMFEIHPEEMKKGKLYYIQNQITNSTGSGRQKGIFTGNNDEYYVYFTNIDNFNNGYSGYAIGDGGRNKKICKFYLPQLQTIIDKRNHRLYCLAMETFINEKTNTLIGTHLVNVSERMKNKISYFVSNETET